MLPYSNIVETVQVMLRQETDYSVSELILQNDDSDVATVNSSGRAKMVDWCCRVIKYCNLEIETVSIAMNYTDRMCIMQPCLLSNPCKYQLVAMTALYTAAKIHAPEALDPRLVSNLSRGTYTAEEIEEQERIILANLQWKVNPPTAHSFVWQFFELVKPAFHVHENEAVVRFAMQQIDSYICKHYCESVISPSVIAYCAFMDALGYFAISTSADKSVVFGLGYNIAQMINLDLLSDEILILKAQNMLGSLLSGSQQYYLEHRPRGRETKRSRKVDEIVDTAIFTQQRQRLSV